MVDLDTLRRYADIVIRRACGFGTLAITTTMVGFAGEPGLSLRCGAVLFGLMAAILVIKAGTAPRSNYKRTELWLFLRKEPPALPPDRLQQLIGGVMADRCLWHAKVAAGIGAALFAFALLLRLAAGL
ncbi:MAG: hypothetical protein JNM79_18410 [Burkholderiales bacterium]|nr:hypothetical protein [Burkholderiales bacterium]